MAKTTVRHVAALFAGLSLLAAACGSDNGSSSDTTGAPATEAPATEAATATTEAAGASTTAAAAGGTAGALAGMKGTTPLVELSQDFKDKLLEVDPALKDFNYAAETYDAVTIIALAAEKAKTDGIDYAKEINGITRDGEKCTDFATLQGRSSTRAATPTTTASPARSSSPATVSRSRPATACSQFGADNRIDDAADHLHRGHGAGRRRRAPGPGRGHPRR